MLTRTTHTHARAHTHPHTFLVRWRCLCTYFVKVYALNAEKKNGCTDDLQSKLRVPEHLGIEATASQQADQFKLKSVKSSEGDELVVFRYEFMLQLCRHAYVLSSILFLPTYYSTHFLLWLFLCAPTILCLWYNPTTRRYCGGEKKYSRKNSVSIRPHDLSGASSSGNATELSNCGGRAGEMCCKRNKKPENYTFSLISL